jgi:hypothetical protein
LSSESFQDCHFPNWTKERLIREAGACWNLQHDPADPETCEWALAYNATLAFLRHWQSGYDEALAVGEDRDELHQSINEAARLRYPWLRLSRDPRTERAEPFSEKPIYAQRSKDLSEMISEKNHLIRVKQELRKAFRPDYKQRVDEINAEIREIEATVAKLTKSFKIDKGEIYDGYGVTSSLMFPIDLNTFLAVGDSRPITSPPSGLRVLSVTSAFSEPSDPSTAGAASS